MTLSFTATDHALTCHWSLCLGDDRILAFLVIIVVKIYDHPIVCPAELVRPRGIGEQRCEVPFTTVGMQNGQPCKPFRIEPLRSDFRQSPSGRSLSIFPIDIEQALNRRRRLRGLMPGATATEQHRKARLDRCRATWSNSIDGRQPTIMRGNLQRLQAFDM